MLILRLRQAQVAVADGRLDEAFALLRRPDAARHRCGQRLVGRATVALVARGHGHLSAGRLSAAAADADMAALLAGNRADVAALRDAVVAAVRDRDRRVRHRDAVVSAARVHVDGGRLQLGAALLDDRHMDNTTRTDALRHDLDGRRATAAAAVAAARAAVNRGHLAAAAAEVGRAQRAAAAEPDVRAAAGAVADALAAEGRAALAGADLRRADHLSRLLDGIDPDHPDGRHLRAVLSDLRRAWAAVAAGDHAAARARLARTTPLLAGAAWVGPVAAHLEAAERATAALRASPLAVMDEAGPTELPGVADPSPVPTPPAPAAGPLPARFVVHVDGVGSALVIRSPSAVIGPVAGSTRADVPVVADPAQPPVHVERRDDDYFASDGRGGPRRLLASGERLAVSPRCRFAFRLPCPASTSAVLEFGAGQLARAGDVRRVVLMDHDLVIGPGPAAHLPVDEAGGSGSGGAVVLHVRDGQLFCRSQVIPVGPAVAVGGLSVSVSPA